MVASPAAMAGLPGSRARVRVGPPLFAKGPRRGSPEMFPEPGEVLEASVIDASSTRLFLLVTILPVPA